VCTHVGSPKAGAQGTSPFVIMESAGTAPTAPSATIMSDPMLELMGWKAEPLLLKRLPLYVVEAGVELLFMAGSMCVSHAFLSPPAAFWRLLIFPFAVGCLRFVWGARLAISYYRIQGVDVRIAINRMGRVHTRSFWSLSIATLTCLSAVLMVWHAIMFLLMTGYAYAPGEAFAVKYVLGTSFFFVIVNWLWWRDVVKHCKDGHEEPDDVRELYAVFRLHKAKTIQMSTFREFETSSQCNAADASAVAVEDGTLATTCAICLEDFAAGGAVAVWPHVPPDLRPQVDLG